MAEEAQTTISTMVTDSSEPNRDGEILEEGLKEGATQEDGYQGYITTQEQGDRLRQRYNALKNGEDPTLLKHANSVDDIPRTESMLMSWRKKIYEAITDYRKSPKHNTPAKKTTATESSAVEPGEEISPVQKLNAPVPESLPVANDTGKSANIGPAGDHADNTPDSKKKDTPQTSRIKALKPLEVELIAHEILSLAVEAHKGNTNYPPWAFIKDTTFVNPLACFRDYPNFTLRMEDVLEGLRTQKNIVYKFTIFDPKMRAVATPSAETSKSRNNAKSNDRRTTVYSAGKKVLTEQEKAAGIMMPPPKTSRGQGSGKQRKPSGNIPSSSPLSRSDTPSKPPTSSGNPKGKGKATVSSPLAPASASASPLAVAPGPTSASASPFGFPFGSPFASSPLASPSAPSPSSTFISGGAPHSASRTYTPTSLPASRNPPPVYMQQQQPSPQVARRLFTPTSRSDSGSMSMSRSGSMPSIFTPLGMDTRIPPTVHPTNPSLHDDTRRASASGTPAHASGSDSGAAAASANRRNGKAMGKGKGKEKGRERVESKSPPEGSTPKKKVRGEEDQDKSGKEKDEKEKEKDTTKVKEEESE
ncbi:hypothetical protein SMACR_09442 [Sordaria macrospora]|uniref:WGS project CABT00000000 data, contig 2.89 n=2 Tax=Sordaria macrospora TaxID=5147 RepID=F7WBY9_SORMK|nr:uncharacterized protein SMAC_09442 [Sordaria macrospora k-hell]KAA8628006.1 hypothetical protein SMACR_09442 [Sordaria macrospora]WPJ62628.1 hypothetical protein SMAC4_09442 [Sordaria macrospora]CCC05512.1 unnamed protein product [Sordaria macrospora k-hell]